MREQAVVDCQVGLQAAQEAQDRSAVTLTHFFLGIEAQAHVVDRRDLQHEVVNALLMSRADGEAVVPPIHVEEGQVHLVSEVPTADLVAQLEAQQVTVERDAARRLVGADHHMAETQLACDEGR